MVEGHGMELSVGWGQMGIRVGQGHLKFSSNEGRQVFTAIFEVD